VAFDGALALRDAGRMDHALEPSPIGSRAATTRQGSAAGAGAAAWRLSLLVAALMSIQSAASVLVPAVYRDTGWITAAWFGNDLVTLVVAVPLLLWALYAVRRGSLRAELIWYAMLGYAVYNYAYYLFGAALNAFFPVYAALFFLPAFALILALGRADVSALASSFAASTPRSWVAAYMLFTGVGLAIAWIGQWAAYLLAGTVPNIGVDAFQLVAAMDLTFMVPWFVVGAVLLLRGAAWGYVVAPIIIVKGAAYTLVLATTSTVAGLRGVEGSFEQVPIWAAWTLLGFLAAWGLFANVRTAPPHRAGRKHLAADLPIDPA
jgi:hypothetical protein